MLRKVEAGLLGVPCWGGGGGYTLPAPKTHIAENWTGLALRDSIDHGGLGALNPKP